MIYYYSGCGNSRYVAESLSKELGEDLEFIPDLIDKGVDVGLPYMGNAPDLGAYEFGIVLQSSSSIEFSSSSEALVPESSSAVESSSSQGFGENSSSSETVTSILNLPDAMIVPNGEMQVFDAQGKFLGGRIPSQAGIYLVRQGNSIFRIRKR